MSNLKTTIPPKESSSKKVCDQLSVENYDENIVDEYTVFISTVSASNIKTLSEALKEVLMDVNMYIDRTGIKIMSMDGSKIAFVHLKLEASQFEKFYCNCKDEAFIQIGVNMISFFKLLKSIGNNDTLTLYIKKNNQHNLGILIENKDRSLKNDILLKLLDLDNPILKVPDVVFDNVITMPCADFQKYCRDLSSISEDVIISSNQNIFSMEVEGDFAQQKITIEETMNGLVFSRNESAASGRFPLKYLNLFCKSSNLCSNIELYLKTSYPLILVFAVANLGNLKFALAPIIKE